MKKILSEENLDQASLTKLLDDHYKRLDSDTITYHLNPHTKIKEVEFTKRNAILAYRNAIKYYRERYPQDGVGLALATVWDDVELRYLT